jgi:hypothetical protein
MRLGIKNGVIFTRSPRCLDEWYDWFVVVLPFLNHPKRGNPISFDAFVEGFLQCRE